MGFSMFQLVIIPIIVVIYGYNTNISACFVLLLLFFVCLTPCGSLLNPWAVQRWALYMSRVFVSKVAVAVELSLHYLLEASLRTQRFSRYAVEVEVEPGWAATRSSNRCWKEKIKLIDFVGRSTDSIGAQYLADIGFCLCFLLKLFLWHWQVFHASAGEENMTCTFDTFSYEIFDISILSFRNRDIEALLP